ncbi:helix-turn-helix domain-containing protein [bacterium]|nr:helix-turn-helix domain-containing protein [bacterium]
MKNLRHYMSVKEAAAYIGVSANTLRNWGKTGKTKERRNPVNGYRVYDKNELDELLQRINEGL